jgi:hypothetical protein
MKLSAELWIAGVVFFVVGLRLAKDEDILKTIPKKMGDDLDFMGHDDYFADMAGGVNVFKKGSNIKNEDFVLSKKAEPFVVSPPRKVRITNKSEAL